MCCFSLAIVSMDTGFEVSLRQCGAECESEMSDSDKDTLDPCIVKVSVIKE